ncbi:MAM and LDL-receptor class A domain-containing 2-like [Paramuricea clavata]|uniref:MAM and LDL-receptor class A domain-containing 2-like n=1 Tax=Paramuricea clavata TaxID=317549 RepID=A0A6S7JKJ2_PARCT|nr:MAM and LDL-receptor class A domain-containing 2-like [Paramuricea clavata]
MDSLWSLSGDQGNGWHQAQVAVNNQMASYQFVIEGVRGKSFIGDIAIDDISLMDSCPARDKFFCDFEDLNSCQWTQDKSDDFDWTRNQASTPLEGTGPLTDHTKSSGRTSDHEDVGGPSNAHKFPGDTELNERPDTLKTGATSDADDQEFFEEDDEYVIPASGEPQHETPGQNEIYEEPKLSPENPVYTELDLNGRNTTEDGTYQKLVKQDSDYVIAAHERRESYQDIKMGENFPDYTELDQSKRETEV